MINSSDSLLYNLSYLSSVIHPVIILRLLEHRLFTPLFKKKSITSNPPTSNHTSVNDSRTAHATLTPAVVTCASSSIGALHKYDALQPPRNSLTKDAATLANNVHDNPSLLSKLPSSINDKQRRHGKSNHLHTSTSGTLSMNSQVSTANTNNTHLSSTSVSISNGTGNNDLSSFLSSTTSVMSGVMPSSLAANSTIQPVTSPMSSLPTNSTTITSTTTRKWFWKSVDKGVPSNLPNDRNPLLQAIVENDTSTLPCSNPSTISASNNAAGVGEIKLFEKELLNLPTFQLSDSQNPLLPSPTCLNYDFPSQFDQTDSTKTTNIYRQHSISNLSTNTKGNHQAHHVSTSVLKSRSNEDDCKYEQDQFVTNLVVD
jgi:hypothetical protein